MRIEDILPLVLVGAALFFFMILPQQRKSKKHQEMLSTLTEGDEVVLNSGVYGFIGAVEGEILWLEVAEGTEFKVLKSAVASVIEVDGSES